MPKPLINRAAAILWALGIIIVFVLSPADPISLYLAEGVFTIVVLAVWVIVMRIASTAASEHRSEEHPKTAAQSPKGS